MQGFSATANSDSDPLNVLMITGGGWHDYEVQQEILEEALLRESEISSLRLTLKVDAESEFQPDST
jgi:hypothetical protein